MSRANHSVSEGILELSSDKFLEVGGSLWFKALEEITSFRFEGKAGSFTARKEHALKKRSEDTGSGEPEYSESASYWYAYRKVEGKTRKRYIGKTEDLTQQRLEEVAAALDIVPEPRPPKQELPNFDGAYRVLENKLWTAQANNESLREENEELKAKILRLEEQCKELMLRQVKLEENEAKSKQIEKEMNQFIADQQVEIWLTKESLRIARKVNEEQQSTTDHNSVIDTWAVLNRLKKRYPKLTIDMVNAISREFSRTSKQKN